MQDSRIAQSCRFRYQHTKSPKNNQTRVRGGHPMDKLERYRSCIQTLSVSGFSGLEDFQDGLDDRNEQDEKIEKIGECEN
jgi:hypothetical protein